MRSPRPGLLPVVMLVVVVVWAVYAVAMLTGTLLTAHQIDARVQTINQVLPRINHNLDSLTLAAQTIRVSRQIDQAVRPVGPRFTTILGDVNGIDASARSIARRVAAIDAGARSISSQARSINPLVVSIGAALSTVRDRSLSINASARGIDGRFDRILGHVHSIDDRLTGGNHRADTVLGTAGGIRDDFDLLTRVLVPAIVRNSHAIAGSAVLDPADTSRLAPLLSRLPVPAAQLPTVPGPSALLHPPVPVTGPVGTATTVPLPGAPRGDGPPRHRGPDRPASPLGGLLGQPG